MHETPLKTCHQKLGARLVAFGGWEMPLQYTSILDEARNVRTHGGLFDLCHMGRVRVNGPEAEALLQKVVTNDVSKIKRGAIRYALLTKEDGNVLDDVLVYRDPDAGESFFVVVNAANRERDVDWMHSHAAGMDCQILDVTHELAMVALQGPSSEATLRPLTDIGLGELGYYKWTAGLVCEIACHVSRTGYTGEDGFEVYFPAAHAVRLWEALLDTSRDREVRPTGLGARDTLRLEAAMPLYGHELTEDINPYEAGLGWAVKLKTSFIGRDALARVKEEGPRRRLVGLITESRRVPRQGYPVRHDGKEVGVIASGTFSPVRNKNIATAFVPPELASPGTKVGFVVRDREEVAEVVELPFYKRSKE